MKLWVEQGCEPRRGRAVDLFDEAAKSTIRPFHTI